MHTIDDISKATGLNPAYIRKCLNELETELKPYISRGKHNKILIDSNGAVLFDRIKQLKEQGLSIPGIKTRVQTIETDGKQTENKPIETPGKQGETESKLLERVFTLQEQLTQEKDERRQEGEQKAREIREWVQKYEALSGALKMLPGGSPEGIQAELERSRQEVEHHQQQVAQTRQDAILLLAELKKSSGLFQGKRRQALLSQLETLLAS